MATENLEWISTRRRMKTGVVPVLLPQYPTHPLFRTFGEETMKIGLNGAVDHLCLAIGLRMVGGTLLRGCSLETKQFSPKEAKEHFVPIRNNRLRNAVGSNHFSDKHYNDCSSREWVAKREKMAILA